MRSAARVLAVWLTPVALLAVPAALCGRAADGLWLGLAWALVPLIVLGLQTGPRPAGAGFPGGMSMTTRSSIRMR